MTKPGESDLPVRRYTDAEVRRLLERAARLQGGARSTAVSQGLTLAQLEDIAAEADIDVTRLREAARELDMGALQPAGVVARMAGAPFRTHVEQTLSFEVDVRELGALVHSISGFTGETGESNLVGRTFTWDRHATSGRRMHVRITVGRGTTHVWVEERYTEVASGIFGGVLGGLGGASIGLGAAALTVSAAAAAAVPVVVVGGGYAACRAAYRRYVMGRGRRLGALCDRIVQDLTAMKT